MSDKKLLKSVYLRNRDIQTHNGLCTILPVQSVRSCIQTDRDLWRIYVDSIESRKLLFSDGFTLHNINVSVFDTNSFSAGTENPDERVVRVPIRGIPLSVEDSCIAKH